MAMTDIQEVGQEGFMWGTLSNYESSGGICGGGEKPPQPPEIHQEVAGEKPAKSKKRQAKGRNAGGGNGESSPDHEIHIWTERERRKKMRNMFANLHALLPQLPPKADKSTIVDEAVSYIKTLQQTLQKLQMQKLEKLQSSVSTTTFTYDPSSSSSTLITSHHQTQLPAVAEIYTRESFLADQISSCLNPNPSALYNASPVAFQTWTSSNVVLNICGNDAQFSVCCPKNKLGFLTNICYLLEKHKLEVVSAHVSSDCHRSIYMIQTRANAGYDNQMTDPFGADEMFKQAAGEIMLWMSA